MDICFLDISWILQNVTLSLNIFLKEITIKQIAQLHLPYPCLYVLMHVCTYAKMISKLNVN